MENELSQLLPALGVWTEALMVSADCRLAPEHKLQAQALGDCDGWLDTCEIDFKLIGCQYHTPLGCKAPSWIRCINGSSSCSRICAVDTVFGGVVRTRSEKGPSEAVLSLEILDRFWRLSLPAGETRDRPIAKSFRPMTSRLGAQ